jgi:hypothetical protein
MVQSLTHQVTFVWEGTSGTSWEVKLNAAGVGFARQLPASNAAGEKRGGSSPAINTTTVALTVDGGSVATFRSMDVSRLGRAAIFNTGQALSALLTA